MKKIVIAIDGHSSCGKSTMAKQLAKRIGYIYVDTGAMYRCVTLYALRHGLFDQEDKVRTNELEKALANVHVSFLLNSKTNHADAYLNGENVETEIRQMTVSSRVSRIAAVPAVREKLVSLQREMGLEKGIVMDGRDIGTVVFPNAELKVFVTASAEIRAQRRYDELTAKGTSANYDEVLHNVQERDYIDSHRAVSPLRKADDAIVLDNSTMTIAEQDAWLMEHYEKVAKE